MYHIVGIFRVIFYPFLFDVQIEGGEGRMTTNIRNTTQEKPCTSSDTNGTLNMLVEYAIMKHISKKEKMVEEESRVEQRKRATRDRILRICEELFILENDYDNVTMREIARRAKVSVGALYLHFKTKEDILATLIAGFTTKQREDLEAAVPKDGNGAQQLDKLLNFFDQLCSNPRFALYSQLPLLHLQNGQAIANAIRQTIIDDMNNFVDFVTEIFREGKADGSLNFDVDPHLAAVTLIDASVSLMLGITMRKSFSSLLAFPSSEYNIESIFSVFRAFLSKAMILSHHKSTETG